MHHLMNRLAHFMAALGGLVLTALILLTCASILGRLLNTALHSISGVAPDLSAWALGLGIGPINGDFELVEAGVAFAIFSFIPICQLTGGHADVDIFTSRLSPRINNCLRLGIEVVFAAVLVLIAVQLTSGMLAKRSFGETTFLLQFPIWWSYAASSVAAWVGAIVGVYMVFVRAKDVQTGGLSDPTETGS